jgi:hypothetical protein
MKIALPAVIYMLASLNIENERGIRMLGMSFPDDGTMLCKASFRKDVIDSPGWILDADANFTELIPRARRRESLRWLSYLLPTRFVLSEYAIGSPRKITYKELSGLLASIRDEYPEAPLAANLRKLVTRKPADELVSRDFVVGWATQSDFTSSNLGKP